MGFFFFTFYNFLKLVNIWKDKIKELFLQVLVGLFDLHSVFLSGHYSEFPFLGGLTLTIFSLSPFLRGEFLQWHTGRAVGLNPENTNEMMESFLCQ